MAYTTIDDPTIYFNTVLFSGNETARSITGIGFEPDWVWIKDRSQSYNHHLFDVIRSATKRLKSDTSDAESTNAQTLTAFNSDGFSLGTDNATNGNGSNVVSWNWKAGDSNTSVSSSGSGNNAINACTHRANTTAGFSIVKYTGLNSEISNGQKTKVTHGLGAKPDFLIIKNKDSSSNWIVTRGIDNDNHGVLNNTDAFSGSLFTGNQRDHSDSTHFVVGNEGAVNANGDEFIAYVFAEKQGFSKFGTYTGNGSSTDGPFVFTGFKAAWIMIKELNGADTWVIYDNKRIGYNTANHTLEADGSGAEGTATDRFNILSNGFKITFNWTPINTSGQNYLFMAFAESPFVSSNGIPTTAR